MSRTNNIYLIGLLLFAALGCVGADTNGLERLRLDECLDLALSRSFEVLKAEYNMAISRDRERKARSEALPSLRIDAYYRRLDDVQEIEIGDEITTAGSLDSYSVDFRLQQLLWASGKVDAALKAANANREYAEWQRRQVDQQVARDVRISFFDLLLAEDSVAVQSESLAQFTSLLKEAEDKYKHGAVAEFDVVSARVRVSNERPLLIVTENNFEVGVRSFARLLNDDRGRIGPLGELKPVEITNSVEQLEAMALSQRPLLQMLSNVVNLRVQDVRATRSTTLPRISAYANYNGANSFQYASFEDDFEWHWSAGLVASWNVWDGGLTRAAVSEKRHDEQISRLMMEDAVKDVLLQVRESWLDYKAANEAMLAADGTVAQARRAVDIAKAGYVSGVSSYLETTDAALSLRRARLTYLKSVREVSVSAVKLMYAAGIPARQELKFKAPKEN